MFPFINFVSNDTKSLVIKLCAYFILDHERQRERETEIYIYIYIYIEREREKGRRETNTERKGWRGWRGS